MPIKRILTVILSLAIAACASQFANSYIGKSSIDLELDLGKPVNIVQLPDGRRSFQYYWGGGTYVTPQTTTGRVNVIGNTAYVNSETSPAVIHSSPGCLINFICEKRGNLWIVTKATWPDRLVC